MSSNYVPHYRKKVEHKRARRLPPEELEEIAAELTDGVPVSAPGPLIESVQNDPTASRQPSLQEEPPRSPGP